MNFRPVKTTFGHRFKVPERIQRIDSDSTHGWQLRYGRMPTEFFSDTTHNRAGAAASLEHAVAALHKRVRRLPAPTGLKTEVAGWKKSGLPVGISGPREHRRADRQVAYYSFQVSVPLASGGSTTRQVYIGTQNTMDDQRFDTALAKAVLLRDAAVEAYTQTKTRAKRRDVAAMQRAT
jgi:hypothetical protein